MNLWRILAVVAMTTFVRAESDHHHKRVDQEPLQDYLYDKVEHPTIDDVVKEIKVSCNTWCRSFDVTVKFQYGIKEAYVGTKDGHCSMHAELSHSNRAYSKIPLYGCGTYTHQTVVEANQHSLTFDYYTTYKNYLVVKVQVHTPYGYETAVREYELKCAVSDDDKEKMIESVHHGSHIKGDDPHSIEIPYECQALTRLENSLPIVGAGERCVLDTQCPHHATCAESYGGKECKCDAHQKYVAERGHCVKVAASFDPCHQDEDCRRHGSLQAKCLTAAELGFTLAALIPARYCLIRMQLGGFCLSNIECLGFAGAQGSVLNGPWYCDTYSHTCVCHPLVTKTQCSTRYAPGNLSPAPSDMEN